MPEGVLGHSHWRFVVYQALIIEAAISAWMMASGCVLRQASRYEQSDADPRSVPSVELKATGVQKLDYKTPLIKYITWESPYQIDLIFRDITRKSVRMKIEGIQLQSRSGSSDSIRFIPGSFDGGNGWLYFRLIGGWGVHVRLYDEAKLPNPDYNAIPPGSFDLDAMARRIGILVKYCVEYKNGEIRDYEETAWLKRDVDWEIELQE